MKKKKALKRLEAAILEAERQSDHNTELRRTQIQLTRRLEDGQAWANAATSRLRQAEEQEREKSERIETLQSMNDEAARVIREKSLALDVANETIRRREQVIDYYVNRFGSGPSSAPASDPFPMMFPDQFPVMAAPMADDDNDDETTDDGDPVSVTIRFGFVGVDENGEEIPGQEMMQTFTFDMGAGVDDETDDDDDRDDNGEEGAGWCDNPDCEVCNAAKAMMQGDQVVDLSFSKVREEARLNQRKMVFAELGEVLDQAARFLNRPFTNGKGVQSWELRGRLAELQIEYAQLNANDLGETDDPPAYRALRSKIVDFARGVVDLTGETFGDALTPQRALADGADPSDVPAPWGTAAPGCDGGNGSNKLEKTLGRMVRRRLCCGN